MFPLECKISLYSHSVIVLLDISGPPRIGGSVDRRDEPSVRRVGYQVFHSVPSGRDRMRWAAGFLSADAERRVAWRERRTARWAGNRRHHRAQADVRSGGGRAAESGGRLPERSCSWLSWLSCCWSRI